MTMQFCRVLYSINVHPSQSRARPPIVTICSISEHPAAQSAPFPIAHTGSNPSSNLRTGRSPLAWVDHWLPSTWKTRVEGPTDGHGHRQSNFSNHPDTTSDRQLNLLKRAIAATDKKTLMAATNCRSASPRQEGFLGLSAWSAGSGGRDTRRGPPRHYADVLANCEVRMFRKRSTYGNFQAT